MKKFLLLAVIIIGLKSLYAQSPKSFEATYSKAAAIKDLQIMQNIIYKTHPRPFEFITKDSLDYYFKQTADSITDSIKQIILYVKMLAILHKVGCGHTVLLPPTFFMDSIKANPILLPNVELNLVNKKLIIVKNNSADSSIAVGSELLSINGKLAEQLIVEISAIISVDGFNTTRIEHVIATNFHTQYYFLYGASAYYTLQIKNQAGNTSTHTIKGSRISKNIATTASNIDTLIKYKTLALLKEKNNDSILNLRISSFGVKKQRRFYKKAFEYIEKSKINNLVIDLRKNGGGNIMATQNFLKYLINEKFLVEFGGNQKVVEKQYLQKKFMGSVGRILFSLIPTIKEVDNYRYHKLATKPNKKNHFHGNLFVITDGGTFSAASFAATILKQKANATLVGQETGGGEAGSNGMKNMDYTLPESSFRFKFQYYHFRHNIKTENKTNGIMPDYVIQKNETNITSQVDVEWETIKKLIIKN
jgi:C-terminal processing protease CtpA/Prc